MVFLRRPPNQPPELVVANSSVQWVLTLNDFDEVLDLYRQLGEYVVQVSQRDHRIAEKKETS